MRSTRFVLILSVLLVPNLVAAEPILMNLGFRLNTFDAYEFAGGILQPTGNTAMGINVFGNHGSLGGELVIAYIVSGEALWTSTTVYCRPKWRYMFAKSHIESYSKWKASALGIDIGVGFSGSSPLIGLYVGYLHSVATRIDKYYVGLAMNL